MILTGRKVFAIAMTWFLIVLGVNSIFLTKAIETRKGLALENAYLLGSHYNQLQDSSDIQKQKGLSAKATFQTTPEGRVTLKIEGFEKNQNLSLKAGTVQLIRPIEPEKDQKIDLECLVSHCQSAPLTLDKGQWSVEALLTTAQDETIHLKQRLKY
jgi:nitrogen fixation protein FixH